MSQSQQVSTGYLKTNSHTPVMHIMLEGELSRSDLHDLTLMFSQYAARGVTQIILDFSLVTHIDFRALGTLEAWNLSLRAQGGRMKLCQLSLYLKTIFRTVNLLAAFEVYESKGEAQAAFSAASHEYSGANFLAAPADAMSSTVE
jgi:anti-anti-sigma factor